MSQRVSPSSEALFRHDIGPAPYAFNWVRGIAAGLIATSAFTAVLYFGRPSASIPTVDLAGMLGTLLVPDDGPGTFWLGMAVHFIMSGLYVLIYARILYALRLESNFGTGLVLGVVVWLAAMFAIPGLMVVHPLVREGLLRNPGIFLADLGAGYLPAAFLLIDHLLYGALAGAIYRHSPQA